MKVRELENSLEKMGVHELRKMAKKCGILSPTSKNKSQLIQELLFSYGNNDSEPVSEQEFQNNEKNVSQFFTDLDFKFQDYEPDGDVSIIPKPESKRNNFNSDLIKLNPYYVYTELYEDQTPVSDDLLFRSNDVESEYAVNNDDHSEYLTFSDEEHTQKIGRDFLNSFKRKNLFGMEWFEENKDKILANPEKFMFETEQEFVKKYYLKILHNLNQSCKNQFEHNLNFDENDLILTEEDYSFPKMVNESIKKLQRSNSKTDSELNEIFKNNDEIETEFLLKFRPDAITEQEELNEYALSEYVKNVDLETLENLPEEFKEFSTIKEYLMFNPNLENKLYEKTGFIVREKRTHYLDCNSISVFNKISQYASRTQDEIDFDDIEINKEIFVSDFIMKKYNLKVGDKITAKCKYFAISRDDNLVFRVESISSVNNRKIDSKDNNAFEESILNDIYSYETLKKLQKIKEGDCYTEPSYIGDEFLVKNFEVVQYFKEQGFKVVVVLSGTCDSNEEYFKDINYETFVCDLKASDLKVCSVMKNAVNHALALAERGEKVLFVLINKNNLENRINKIFRYNRVLFDQENSERNVLLCKIMKNFSEINRVLPNGGSITGFFSTKKR